MSVIQLTEQHFYLEGHRTKTLNITLDGVVFVFFKMKSCGSCAKFEPEFHRLVQTDKRIKYAVCDVTPPCRVPLLSRETGHAINAVPCIFIYSGGFPVAKYKGRRNLPSLQAFIGKALQAAQSRQQRIQRPFVPNAGHRPYPSAPNFTQQPKYWKPEMGKEPSVKGIVKGQGNTQYSYLNEVEEEDDTKAFIPEQVTPHNMPWGTGYKKMGTLD